VPAATEEKRFWNNEKMVFDKRKFKNRLPRATSSSTWRPATRRPGRQKSCHDEKIKTPVAMGVHVLLGFR
jgi:hypothetical protein